MHSELEVQQENRFAFGAEDVQSLAEGFKKGNSDIVEKGHTVIFHTNGTTPNMLRQVIHLILSENSGSEAP
jgi:hypothetical protein